MSKFSYLANAKFRAMKRGEFIKIISGGVVLLATGRKAQAANPKGAKRRKPLRFGILTDTHYSDREVGGTRHYRDSLQKTMTMRLWRSFAVRRSIF